MWFLKKRVQLTQRMKPTNLSCWIITFDVLSKRETLFYNWLNKVLLKNIKDNDVIEHELKIMGKISSAQLMISNLSY